MAKLEIDLIINNQPAIQAANAAARATAQLDAAAQRSSYTQQQAINQAASAQGAATRKAVAGAHQAAGAQAAANARIKQGTSATFDLGAAGTKMLATFAGVSGVTQAFRMFTAAIEKAEEHMAAMAKASIDFEHSQRALVALKEVGAAGTSGGGQPSADAMKLMVASGLSQQAATEYEYQFESAIGAGMEKGNITRDLADKLKVEGAIRANRLGGDPRAYAELTGLLPMFGKIGSQEQAFGQAEAVRNALKSGRGQESVLMPQLLEVAGSLVSETGAVRDVPEMAALVSAMSLASGPGQAGERTQQLYRGLKVGLTKFRKGQNIDFSQAEYLENLGIKENMNLEQMLDIVAPDIQKAIGEGHDPTVYLGMRGFRSYEERRALVEATQNYDVVKKRLAESRAGASAGVGAAEIAANRAFLAGPAGQGDVAAALGVQTNVLEGEQFKQVEAARALIAQQMQAAGEEQDINTHIGDRMNFWRYLGGGRGGREGRIGQRTNQYLEEMAQKAGVFNKWTDFTPEGANVSDEKYEQFLIGKLKGAGIDPVAELVALMKRENEQQTEHRRWQREQAQKQPVADVRAPLPDPRRAVNFARPGN